MNTKNKSQVKAFTLIEALTTLMVIGVVAATLIPLLYNSIKEDIMRTQFTRAYAVIISGIKLASSEMDGTPKCYKFTYGGKYLKPEEDSLASTDEEYNSQTKDCAVLYEKILSSFKIVKTCKSQAFPECIPEYHGYDYIWKQKTRKDPDFVSQVKDMCPGCTDEQFDILLEEKLEAVANKYKLYDHPLATENIKNLRTAHVLASGEIILEFGMNGDNVRNFAVDVNGKKAPNKWGYDLFPFIILGNPSMPLIIGDNGTDFVEDGGLTTKNMIKKTIYKENVR